MLKRLVKRIAGMNSRLPVNLYEGLNIGRGTCCAVECLDSVAPQLITIGENCIVAPKAMILAHDASLFIHTGKYRVEPVRIGNRVFIGYGAIVMPGVTIGDGAVIGAGAVVTRDIPADTVAAGVPARILGPVSDMVARNQESLIAPHYPGGHVPSMEDVLRFQRSILKSMGKSAKA